MQEFKDNYLNQNERMNPQLENMLKSNTTDLADNPAFPKTDVNGNPINFLELIAYKRFLEVVERVKRYTNLTNVTGQAGMSRLTPMLMQGVNFIEQVEQPHKLALENLAVDLVVEEMEIPDGVFQFQCKIVNRGEINQDGFQKETKEPSEEEINQTLSNEAEAENMTPSEFFEMEKHKRRFINMLIQGSSKKGHYMFELVRNKLNEYNPNLAKSYGEVMSINDLIYWLLDDETINQMASQPSAMAGKEEIEQSEDGTIIKTEAICFPVSLHEIIKGIMETFGTQGLPDDPQQANMIIDAVDSLSNETMDLRLGAIIWEKFINAYPRMVFVEGNRYLQHYLFSRFCGLETTEFFRVARMIMANDPKGAKYMERMTDEIISDLNVDEFEENKGDNEDDINIDDLFNYKKGGQTKNKKGDIGKSGTQYGYTLKEWDKIAEKNGLLVSPTQWWKSRQGKYYIDYIGKSIKVDSEDKQFEMNRYGYMIANGMDLGSDKIPASAKKYVQDNNFNKFGEGGKAGFDIYNYDEKMALINLGQVYEYAIKLDKIIKEDTDLEEWVKMKLTRIEQNISDVKHSLEGWEKYEDGGEIPKKQLLHIAKYSKDLIEMISNGSKLMSWQEDKLAISSASIDDIYHHLDYEMGNRAEDLDVDNEYAGGGEAGDDDVFDARKLDTDSEISSRVYYKGVNNEINKILQNNYKPVYDFDKKGIEWVYKNTIYEIEDEDLILELKEALAMRNRSVVDMIRINNELPRIESKYGKDVNFAKKMYQEAKDFYQNKLRNEKSNKANDVLIDYLISRLKENNKEFAEGGKAQEYGRGGFMSKGELVWKKLSSAEKMNFLSENFTPQITPRSQEILVGKAYNFLPKNVKIVLQSKYANVEDYAGGGEANENTKEIDIDFLKKRYFVNYYIDNNKNIEITSVSSAGQDLDYEKFGDSLKKIILEEIISENDEYAYGGEVQEWMEKALQSLIEETGNNNLQIFYVRENDFTCQDDDSEEYRVFKNEDLAYDYAVEEVESDMEYQPENFNRDFIMEYVEIDDLFVNSFENINYDYTKDIQSEKSEKYENRLIEELVANGLISEEEAQTRSSKELDEEYTQDYIDLLTSEQIGDDNGITHFIDNFGENDFFTLVYENNLIDVEDASKKAVEIDGIAHFLAGYDGETIYLDNNIVAYRTN